MHRPAWLLVAIVLLVLLKPLGAGTQQAGKMYLIGFLSDAVQIGPFLPKHLDAFRQGLPEHGCLEGQDVVVDFHESETVECARRVPP